MIKDPAFADAKQNYMTFQNELDDRVKRLETCWGTLAEMDAEYEASLLRLRTCPECGLVCKTMHHMEYVHRDSKKCRTRKAENEGTVYVPPVPPGKERVTCECGLELFRENLNRHRQGSLHQGNMALKKGAYFCKVCKKNFSKNKRPKRDYDEHCKGKKHLVRISQI
mgnify:CR=1 FL=1